MNEKDLYLIGFMSKATEYLKKTLEDQEKTLSIINSQKDVNSYSNNSSVKAGEKAFDAMLKNNDDSIIKEFEDIFNNANINEVNAPVKVYDEMPNTEIKPKLKKIDNKELDSIIGEIVAQEEPKEKQEKVLPKEEAYVEELIQELEELTTGQDRKAQNRMAIFDKISSLYPYLSGGFIRAVYSLKETLAKETPLNIKIVLLHRVYFRDVDSLRHFVEIACLHNYTVNVDETKLLVDVFKEFKNVDGRIITNIYEIANQVRALDGEYDGYRVIEKNK